MDHIKLIEGFPAKSDHARIKCQSAAMAECRKVNRFDLVLTVSKTPVSALNLRLKSILRFDAKIGSEHRDLMAAPRQPVRESSNLDDRPSLFLERIVRLNDFQDAHSGVTFTPRNQTSYASQAKRSAAHSSHLQIVEAIPAGGK